MTTTKKTDLILLGTVTILLTFGALIIASVSASLSQIRFGTTYYYLNHQLFFGLIPGIILGFTAYKINLALIKKWAPLLFLFNIIVLILVFVPKIGFSAGGATRWLNLGPVSFQPSELLKLTFILYLASWLSSRIENKNVKKLPPNFSQTLVAFLIAILVVGLLLFLQPDVSTFVIIISVAVIVYFLAGMPFWHMFLFFLIGAVSMLILTPLAPYRFKRILVFLKPETDPMGIGYQIKQALISIGSGGIFGLGLGVSGQKSGYLPYSMSDSIFAVIAEETGFIGSAVLIVLFLIFLWQGFKIAKNSNDKFSKLLAFGITSWILMQTFINIGSMTGILPLVGIPLPFFSYGGSALLIELVAVGLLLNISKQKI